MKRPHPEALLQRIHAEAAREERGQLTIFLGAAAGVGKTYAMLEAAQQRQRAGVDVVIGYVETHGRAETKTLLAGLEQLPLRSLTYHQARLHEFDLDAALDRRPALILLDELAHTNAPGSRHTYRWQDVEELLHSGIDVYTAVNIQHLESLNDVVAQITGVSVRETVPDSIIDSADDIRLIDLPPDELRQRLRDGKVYVPVQVDQALRHFFRKGNLIALRELALRHTAERVDQQMQRYRSDHAIPTTWPTTERLLVCIGPSPLSARLVRTGRRMAQQMHAEWIVAYVETPGHAQLAAEDRQRIVETLRLAEQLGAQTVTLTGARISTTVMECAQQRNVSKLIVGKPARSRWHELRHGSIVDEIIRSSGPIDVYVITGSAAAAPSAQRASAPYPTPKREYSVSAAVVLLCTLVAQLLFPYLEQSNLIMVYLLGVTWVASRYGRGPSVLASMLSVAGFDFFFITPYYTFAVSDVQYLWTFLVMLIVALVISSLTIRIRQQAEYAQQRERRTAALYALSRALASNRGLANLLRIAVEHISDVFESQAAVLLPSADGNVAPYVGHELSAPLAAREQSTAQWVFDHQQPAGMFTQTLPSAQALYLPLVSPHGPVGVLAVRPNQPNLLLIPEQMRLLETFASHTSIAIERARLADEAQAATVQVESERLRNALLSSVSHDLRTPLASITGAATSLLDSADEMPAAVQTELLQSIADEGQRLNRLLSNLLDMTRLESGSIQIKREWQPLDEALGVVLHRLRKPLEQREVHVDVPIDLPLIPFDSELIDQVLTNLVENVLKYTPPASPLTISAHVLPDQHVQISIGDRGPGIAPANLEQIFEKFARGSSSDTGIAGAGLGLAICRSIVHAHGGRIWAENRSGGGAWIHFTVPVAGTPPALETEAAALQDGE